ncbi:membrane protein [Hipposideros pomona bat coronavirus CHB25]|uniref:Membrane protein n=4 Tax=Coronaviridae TaxID=11118 RepID=A0AAE6R7M1_9ALPC|nr:membrane protein [Hipposideros pomona bat coronavirus CHB25]QHA24727.1 membrane protein [Hipposideros pomona bat coronavirus CHB25]WCC61737.1 membrane protein [Bat Coronavirus HlYN20]WCC61755.1 membrane protein [Bat Coronavirus HlGX16]WCZ55927.1 MAG: M [Hipposideros bat coronavirus] [Hipposideros bat coronavirus]
MSNDSIPVDQVVEHLRNWNFSWNVILTVFLVVLQYGQYKYSRLLYGIKMLILWLLWPCVLALSIFDSWASFNVNWGFFAFSILMACITLVLWIMYFVNSFRLYRRTQTFWAFNPETDAILTLSVFGRQVSFPIIVAPTGITLTVLSGTLLVEGIKVATGVQVNQLPTYVTVAKANTTIVYQRAGRSLNARSNTGWAFYVRSKNGDYSAVASHADSLTDDEKILHLV